MKIPNRQYFNKLIWDVKKKYFIKRKLKKKAIRGLVTSINNKFRLKNNKKFRYEINELTNIAYDAYKIVVDMGMKCQGDMRKSLVAGYVYNAINSLISSTNILILGYLVPSGNLVRNFIESCAMAILLSSKDLKYYEGFVDKYNKKEMSKIKIHKSVQQVLDNLQKIGVDRKAWESFMKLREHYNLYSHPTPFSLSTLFNFETTGIIYMGPYYDKGKEKEYRKEFKTRVECAKAIENIANGIKNEIF